MSIRASAEEELRWRPTTTIAVGIVVAVAIAATGLLFSRPDVVAVGIPPALAAGWALLRRPTGGRLRMTLSAEDASARRGPGAVDGRGDVEADADGVQLAVERGRRRAAPVDAAASGIALRTRSGLLHSGPAEVLALTGRAFVMDGSWVSEPVPRASLTWNAVPSVQRIRALPVAPRLTGLHGAHEGVRPGPGGDFRDIHPFAPGDELRRVDWRATARLARRPGDLLVRRTNTLSDSSVVIAVDTADDLGEVVASWGGGDPERSGTTSLDLAREAALSIATSAVGAGDRVAYHALSPGGTSLRSGAGARHLSRVRNLIAATGPSGDGSRFRRTPPVPHGSIVFVLSTFFDGVAADLARRWRASGHAVIAVDVLPELDARRLEPEQILAMRTLLMERADLLGELRATGVEVISWCEGRADELLRIAAGRMRRQAVRP